MLTTSAHKIEVRPEMHVVVPLHDVIICVYSYSTYSFEPNKSEGLNFTATDFRLIWINVVGKQHELAM